MDKSNAKPIVQVAVAVKTSPWYLARLQDWLQHLPSLVEKGPKVSEFVKKLSAMECSTENIVVIADILKETLTLRDCLRSGSTKDLETLLSEAVEQHFAMIMDKPAVESEVWKDMQNMLGEASILFPLDHSLPDMQQTVATKIEDDAIKKYMEKVVVALQKLETELQAKENTSQAISQTCKEVQKKFGDTTFDESKCTIECKTLALSCLKLLLTYEMEVLFQPRAEALIVEDQRLRMDLALRLSNWPGAGAFSTYTRSLHAACDLEVEVSRLPSNPEQTHEKEKGQPILELSKAVKRKLLHLKKCMEVLPKDEQEALLKDMVTQLHALQGKVSKLLSKLTQSMLDQAKKVVDDTMEEVKFQANGGVADGKWLDTYVGETWDDFLSHCQQTILTLKADDLTLSKKKLEEANHIMLATRCSP
eukprot:5716904-Amphidinium_carterae.3